MPKITELEIQRALAPYGVVATRELCEQIKTYITLLLKWNQKISLTTVTDPAQILRFHFGESFFAAPSVPIAEGRLADVGSGAGFPGLPIRLISRSIEVVLIESNAKKSAFLSEVTRELELGQVTVFHERMEALPGETIKFDFIVARALGKHEEFLNWSSSHLSSAGNVVLWLGEKDASDISGVPGWKWREPLKIPMSERRFLLVGSKTEYFSPKCE
jgi:16S rRNA (guanine527-N7)-methyltransferase